MGEANAAQLSSREPIAGSPGKGGFPTPRLIGKAGDHQSSIAGVQRGAQIGWDQIRQRSMLTRALLQQRMQPYLLHLGLR